MLINLFQRYYLWTFLVLSGCMGLALANLTTTIIEQQYSRAIPTVENQREAVKNKPQENSRPDYQPIINHNIFNSASRNQTPTALTNEPQKMRTASNWALIGTVSGGERPLATLKNSQGTVTFQLGEELPDGAVLSAIERNLVKLRYPDGRTQIIELAEEAQRKKRTPQNKPATSANNLGAQIEELGDNRWLIPAAVAENARSNIGELLKQAQAVPYLENGKTTGFQLRSIRRNSLITQLGLKRGDIIYEVNNLALNSPEKALQLFGQLRRATKISIDLRRRGKAMTFAYEIR